MTDANAQQHYRPAITTSQLVMKLHATTQKGTSTASTSIETQLSTGQFRSVHALCRLNGTQLFLTVVNHVNSAEVQGLRVHIIEAHPQQAY